MPRGSERIRRQGAERARKEGGGLDKAGLKKRDQEFARHVLDILAAAQRGEGPSSEAPADAVRLATSLVFISAQAEEFFRTCPLQNDPRVAVALYVKQLVADLLNRRRHPIEMFFSGLGGAKEYANRVTSQEQHKKTVLGICVHAVLILLGRAAAGAPKVQAAVDRVWRNLEIQNFCGTKETLKHCYRNALLEEPQRVAATTESFLSRAVTPEDVIELTLRVLYFSDQPMDPISAKEVRTHRLYYRLEEDGTVTWEVPPDSPLRGHLLQQAVQSLADQGSAEAPEAESP